jgi:hypothetical protein
LVAIPEPKVVVAIEISEVACALSIDKPDRRDKESTAVRTNRAFCMVTIVDHFT